MVISPKPITQIGSSCELSIVVPIYNEYESIPLLIEKVTAVAQLMEVPYELICVDDGSTDGSGKLLKTLARDRHDLRVILLRRNYGQTPAMAAGFNYARGRVIVTLDGDLQNEPADIATVYH
jgi:glycosyltransferase involved in cell wall biosynthesis